MHCFVEARKSRLDLLSSELFRRLWAKDLGPIEVLPQPKDVQRWWARAQQLNVYVWDDQHLSRRYAIRSRATTRRLAALIEPVSRARAVEDFGEGRAGMRVTIELICEDPNEPGVIVEERLAIRGRTCIYGYSTLRFAFQLANDELFRRLRDKDLNSPSVSAADVVDAWRGASRIDVENSLNNGGRKGTIRDRSEIQRLAALLDPQAVLSESRGSFGRVAAIEVRLFAHEDDSEPVRTLRLIRGRVIFRHNTQFLEFPLDSDELWDRLTYLRFDSRHEQPADGR